MEFTNAITSTKQGDIGEARAIYEYTKLGYTVARTLFDSAKYDLIIDKNGILEKVQVKTTKYLHSSGVYETALKTSGGNRSSSTIRNRQEKDYDTLFVLAENGNCWSIPTTEFKAVTNLRMSSKFNKFLL